MNDEQNTRVSDVTAMAAQIAAAFVGHNTINADDVPRLIKALHGSLELIVQDKTEAPKAAEPAIAIRRSVKPDHIVCLEDGQKFQMLKRHLRTVHGMTPDEYRARWNLSSDYPMVAPQYASERSKLAIAIGLGRARTSKSTKA